jgi:hypothetical protein
MVLKLGDNGKLHMKWGDCGNCPLDPCRITADECDQFWAMVEKYKEITRKKESEEYLGKAYE